MTGGLREHQEGDFIGGVYQVVREIGRGSTSIVYECLDEEGAKVAVKQLRPWAASDIDDLVRYKRDVETLTGFNNAGIPRVVKLLEVDDMGGTTYYLVRELVVGTTLQETADQGMRLDEPLVKAVARELLGLLVTLHSLDPPVLHRAIKPRNVLRRDNGKLCLVDIGAGAHPSEQILGSAEDPEGYASPEQADSNPTQASDVYSVAATLLFLLADRPPAELPHNGKQVVFDNSVRVTPRFLAWLKRALAATPSERFQSAKQALAELDKEEPKPFNWTRAALVVVLVLIVGAGGAGYYFLEVAKPPAKPTAKAPEKVETGAYRAPATRFATKIAGASSLALADAAGALVAGGSAKEGALASWKLVDGTKGVSFAAHPGPAGAVAIGGDPALVLAAGGTKAKLYALADAADKGSLEGHGKDIAAAALSADGKHAATGDAGGEIRIWDAATAKSSATIKNPGGAVHALAFSADGAILASADEGGVVRLWTVADGKQAAELKGHEGPARAVAFTPDGKTLASAGDDRSVRLWDVAGKKERSKLEGHYDAVMALAVSSDGKTLLSGGKKDILFRWSLADGKEIDRRPARMRGIVALAVDQAGKREAALGADGSVAIWLNAGSLWAPKAPGGSYSVKAPTKTEATNAHESLVFDAAEIFDAAEANTETLDKVDAMLAKAGSLTKGFAPLHVMKARVAIARSAKPDGRDAAALKTAIEEADKAIAIDAKVPAAHAAKALALLLSGDAEKASASAAEAAKLGPEDPAAQLAVLQVATARRQTELALQAGKKLFAVTDTSRTLSLGALELAAVYHRLGANDLALRMREARIKYEPESPSAFSTLAQYNTQRGRHEEAIKAAKKALELLSDDTRQRVLAEAHAGYAAALSQKKTAGDLTKAKEQLGLAEKQYFKPNGPLERARGIYYVAKGEVEKDAASVQRGRGHLDKALKIDPKDKLALDERARSAKVEEALQKK